MPHGYRTLGLAAVAALALAGCESMEAKPNMAYAHIGHVTKAWNDTPDKVGLLTAAEQEATTAYQHALLAAQKPGDLGWMKMHALHVVNALDPSVEAKGPGKGYGVVKAAAGVDKHIVYAAESPEATANIKLHATHVSTAAKDVVEWAGKGVELGRKIAAAGSAAEAAPLVRQLVAVCDAILDGQDANGDGKVTWEKGEGGLKQAHQHVQFMVDGERKGA